MVEHMRAQEPVLPVDEALVVQKLVQFPLADLVDQSLLPW